jgi:hypothetical protein
MMMVKALAAGRAGLVGLSMKKPAGIPDQDAEASTETNSPPEKRRLNWMGWQHTEQSSIISTDECDVSAKMPNNSPQ